MDPNFDTQKMQGALLALKEAQDAVRSYDTKAQIIGASYIFAFNIVFGLIGLGGHQATISSNDPLRLLVAWLLILGPLVVFARVLYPSRKIMRTEARGLFYLRKPNAMSVDDYLDSMESCDYAREIASELLNVSKLRELKRKRFIQALWTAAVSYTLMFAFVAIRAIVVGIG